MTDTRSFDDDDLFVSPRILEQRRTGVVHPLERGGLDHLIEWVPFDLAVMGVEVTPDAVIQRVTARLEQGIEWGTYKWPSNEDFRAATAPERLEAICEFFAAQYGKGEVFRAPMSQEDSRELVRSYAAHAFGVSEDMRPEGPVLRLN